METETQVLRSRQIPTVGSLSWAIQAHTSGFTAGVVGTKKELADLRRAFEQSLSPVQKYSMAIERLQDLAAKFPQKAGAINTTIAKLRKEMRDSSPSAQALAQVMGRLGIVMDPVSAAFKVFDLAMGAARAGMQALSTLISKVASQMQTLDETAKKSRLLGISETSLVGLRGAAQGISGVGSEAFDSGLTQFTKRIAEASMTGKGDAAGALSRLGLNAGQLSGMSPDKALLRTAQALREVKNPSERLAIAFDLLGKQGGELATMLAAGDKEILRLADDAVRLQQIKFVDFQGIEEANDALGRLKMKTEGLLSIIGSQFAPLVKNIGNDLAAFGDSTKDAEAFRDVMREIALNVALLADELKLLSDIGAFRLLAERSGLNDLNSVLDAARGPFSGGGHTNVSRLESAFAEQDKRLAAGKGGRNPDQIMPDFDALYFAKEAKDMEERAKSLTDTIEKIDREWLSMEAKGLKEREDLRQKRRDFVNKEYEDRAREISKLQDSLKSPAQKLREEFEHLLGLRNALSPEMFGRGLTDLALKAEGAVGAPERQSIGAIRAGSIEAQRAQFSGSGVQERTLKQVEAQTNEAKAMKDLLREIRDQGKNGPVLKEAV